MSDSTARPGELAGFRTGIDLVREAAGDKDSYDWADHDAVGLPMIVACTGCTMTMAGAAALIDAEGFCWCADCAEIQGGR
jgi:hypothetical protein